MRAGETATAPRDAILLSYADALEQHDIGRPD